MKNTKITNNFKVYDNFLSKQNKREKKILLSLKMMYAIHMENNNINKSIFFSIKQIIRFVLKFFSIAFYKTTIIYSKNNHKYLMLSNTYIEKFISKDMCISLASFKNTIAINFKVFIIYKELFKVLYILLREPKLNKIYVLALIHRLIDYLNVYHNISITHVKAVFIENDRTPINLAFIHYLREKKIKTIKYDNWLIDKVNHNDIYCKYYFYPSLYHKKIIQSFASNRHLTYIKGGFLYWDNLKNYSNTNKFGLHKIVYFTQFGVSSDLHKKYIRDIIDIMKALDISYELIVKIHPRENIVDYKHLLIDVKNIQIIDIVDDVYELIAQSKFCFSMFSTISLEAKHIIKNSYFINYDVENFAIVDYDILKLDTIKSKVKLKQVLKGEYRPISQTEFIKYENCQYPHSIKRLGEYFCHD